ncbi:MAG: DUF4347 domain-containing protein [Rhodocyclaceae bacterium]
MGDRGFGARFKQAIGSILSPRPARTTAPAPRRFVIQEVEARLLYSADIAPGLLDTDNAEVRVVDSHAAATADSTQQQNRITEIVFVDTSVENWQQLLGNLQETRPDIEVITFGANEDGITRISEALQGRSDLSALHFITHGTAGALQLGSTRLDATSLQARSAEISRWGNALNSDADILLYGCNLTANEAGVELADNLAALTGADIAASNDLTGNAAQGGDWVLEYTTGQIETAIAVDAAGMQSWNQTLAVTLGNTSSSATDTTGSTTLTWAHTVAAGSDGMLVVEIASRYNTDATSVTYGGVALTKLSSVTSGGVVTAEIWYLLSPTAGSANVVVTIGGSAHEFVAGASNFFGVDQTTPFGTAVTKTGSGTSVSQAVTSVSGDIVIDVMATRQQTDATPEPGGTVLWTQSVDTGSADPTGGSSYKTATGTSTTMTWSIDSAEYAFVGVAIKAGPVAPVIAVNNAALAYTENATTALDGALTVTDADSTNLTGATIQITGNYQSSQDVLAFTNQLGITGSWNSGTGTLTLSGTTTVANYQTALRSITYNNTSDSPNTSARTVTFTVSDGSKTGSDTRSINVTAVNDNPTGANNTITTNEDTGYTFAASDFGFSDVRLGRHA